MFSKQRIISVLTAITMLTTPFLNLEATKIPIVYHENYNIKTANLFGSIIAPIASPFVSYFHPFDTQKYGKVYANLMSDFRFNPDNFHTPTPVTNEELIQTLGDYLATKPHAEDPHAAIHDYLNALKLPRVVATIAEVPFLERFSSETLSTTILEPMRLATNGTLLACQRALKDNDWAINLSGGYHHAKATSGSGFCFFPDIPFAVCKLWETHSDLKVMIIDLDAHQGNGYEDFFQNDHRITVFDMFNAAVFPHDIEALRHVRYQFPLTSGTSDEEYLTALDENLPKAIETTRPNLIIYNAGTDILAGDPIGHMNVSADGIVRRDQFVFDLATRYEIPIAMLLSGGYTPASAGIITKSIENILEHKGYSKREATSYSFPYKLSRYLRPWWKQ